LGNITKNSTASEGKRRSAAKGIFREGQLGPKVR